MSFYGDLASIGLSDLLQNLEQAQRTGTLTISAGGEETLVHLRDGKVAMLKSPGRPNLVDSLVRHAVISAKQLESAKSRRKGTRRSLGETLQNIGAIDEDQLRKNAQAILTEDLCTLLVRAEGSFRFREGDPPSRVFDPEERRLELRLAMNPVLLEAARRKDHWELVRRVIPTDSMHFVALDPDRVPESIEHTEVAKQLLARLDGSRSVAEVVQTFGVHSFLAHCTLAQLVKERAVRTVESSDLAEKAKSLAGKDPERALQIVRRARETEPRNPNLLAMEADLCEATGDKSGAAAATKILAHIHLERGETERGRKLLEKAVTFDPDDTAVWEKSLGLAIDEGRVDDAIREGMSLVKLYRAPGLHSRAAEVLERLRELKPENVGLAVEWARSRTAAGDPKAAVAELLRLGKVQVGRESYEDAAKIFEAALDIEPGNEIAKKYHDKIENDQIRQRRERSRRFRRRLRAAAVTAAMVTLLVFETWARVDVAEATTEISQNHWIEDRDYQSAHDRLQEVADQYWFTPTRFLELRIQLRNLEERMAEQGAPGGATEPSGD